MKAAFSLCLLLVLGIYLVRAADSPLANEVVPAGSANLGEVKAALEQVLTPRGKVIILPVERKIFIQDTPENLPFVVAIARAMTAPVPNVRIEVISQSVGSQPHGGITIRGNGDVHVDPIQNNAFDLSGGIQGSGTQSVTSQMLLVKSGAFASLEVVHELALADYFPLWLQQNGYAQLVPINFHWEKIGSALMVKPTVSGDYITLDVTPVLTSLDGNTVAIHGLTTTLTVTNGTTTQIGGFTKANDDFNAHFFGSTGSRSFSSGLSSEGGSSGGVITLKVTIEPVDSPPASSEDTH